jgi:hypothetical protein
MAKKFEIGHLTDPEIAELLDLQSQNMRHNLDLETIASQGFVSFRYTPDIMRAKMREAPQIVARADGQLIGYALSTVVSVGRTIPAMVPLLNNIEQIVWRDRPMKDLTYYIMGQVCVRAAYRSIGVFDALYAGHRETFSSRYDCIVTEIANENGRSLAAHRRVGFETVHIGFDTASQKEWHTVAWDWR